MSARETSFNEMGTGMLSYSFARSKLFLAVVELATTEGELIDRVQSAYWHLATLNCTNTHPETFEHLKAIRQEFASRASQSDEDDGTVTLLPLTAQSAALVASEIICMFEEVAKSAGTEAVANAVANIEDEARVSFNPNVTN